MNFRFVPSDPMCFDKLSLVVSKQGDGSVSGQSGPTGVYPEGDHVI